MPSEIPMPIYRLRPTTEDDQNFALAANRGEVIVRARSSGNARAIAALHEAELLHGESASAPDTRIEASAFGQANLYTVVLDESGEFPEEGEDGVLWWPGMAQGTPP